MRIKKIKNKNFCSFEDIELELLTSNDEKNIIYIIDGINKDISEDKPEETSNGSGKSSVIGESVTFSLFNRPLRGGKKKIKIDDLIKRDAEEVEGKKKNGINLFNEVEYFVGDDILSITKTKKKNSSTASTEVKLNGKDQSKRLRSLTNDDIIEFLGIPFDVFSQTSANYTDNDNFIAMNYTQRIDLFKKIISIEFMDEIFDKIDKWNKKSTKELDNIEGDIREKNIYISLMKKNKDDMKKYIQDKIKDLKKELKENELKKKDLINVSEYEEKIEVINDKISKIKDSINELNSVIDTNDREIDKIKKEITKVTKLKETECNNCGQLVSGKYVEEKVTELNKNITTYTKNNEAVKKQLSILNDGTIELLQKEKKENQNKIYENQKLESSISSVEKKLLSDIAKNEKELKNIIPTDEDGISNAESELKELEERKDKLEKILEKSRVLRDLFNHKSNLRSAIYNKYISLVSDLFSHYISKLYNNELISYLSINEEGEIDIVILKDEQEISYWTLSSGERARFNLAIFLALFNFVQCVATNPPSFLILDEPFVNMDLQGHKLALEAIKEIYNDMGVDIFIISHTYIPVEEFDDDTVIKKIHVVKENGISTAFIE